MLFKQAARGDERGFLNIKNVEATSITTGMGVALRIGTAASFDGTNAVRATSATAADLPGFLGVSVKDIPSNGFGLVQCFGYCASVLLSNGATSVTINNGDPLIPAALAGAFASGAPTYAASGFGYVILIGTISNTVSVVAPAYVQGFVRAIH